MHWLRSLQLCFQLTALTPVSKTKSTVKKLTPHKRASATTTSSGKCQSASATASDKCQSKLVQKELNKKNQKVLLNCQHCPFSCLKNKELNMHLKLLHSLNCQLCIYTAKNSQDLNSHQKIEHEQTTSAKNPSALVDIMASNFNAGIRVDRTGTLRGPSKIIKHEFDQNLTPSLP